MYCSGDMADYVVETQKGGRYITYEEVLDILKKAEDNALYIRLPILTEKIKFLPSATVMSMYAMHYVLPSCLIRRICQGLLMLLT